MAKTLKLVKPDERKSNGLDGYEPVLLATQEMFQIYWPQCVEHLDRVVSEAMHGEMDTDDILQLALAGRMQVFAFKKDEGELPDVALVLVMELISYPKFAAMNIVAMGGHDLSLFGSKFWDHIKGWCYMNGIRAIESLVSPAMARVATRAEFGFEPVYTQLRLDLTEK